MGPADFRHRCPHRCQVSQPARPVSQSPRSFRWIAGQAPPPPEGVPPTHQPGARRTTRDLGRVLQIVPPGARFGVVVIAFRVTNNACTLLDYRVSTVLVSTITANQLQ
jgi:hypothetical protein